MLTPCTNAMQKRTVDKCSLCVNYATLICTISHVVDGAGS